jgi:hypothetical protein
LQLQPDITPDYERTNRQRERKKMATYQVTMTVQYNGELEADSKEHAEELAWTSYGDNDGSPLGYFGVDEIFVELLEDDESEGTR